MPHLVIGRCEPCPHNFTLRGQLEACACPLLGSTICAFKKKDFIYLLLARGEGRQKERETSIGCLSRAPPGPRPGDLANNPGTSPDWESNQRPFGLQAGTQSTDPHQPGPPYVPFIVADCNWYPFTVISPNREYNGFSEFYEFS